jgi:hypothetical protein
MFIVSVNFFSHFFLIFFLNDEGRKNNISLPTSLSLTCISLPLQLVEWGEAHHVQGQEDGGWQLHRSAAGMYTNFSASLRHCIIYIYIYHVTFIIISYFIIIYLYICCPHLSARVRAAEGPQRRHGEGAAASLASVLGSTIG